MQDGANTLRQRCPRISLQHHAARTELEAANDFLILDVRRNKENSTEPAYVGEELERVCAVGRDIEQYEVRFQRERRGDHISNTGNLSDEFEIRLTKQNLSHGRLQ
jgi:hypothetical protein